MTSIIRQAAVTSELTLLTACFLGDLSVHKNNTAFTLAIGQLTTRQPLSRFASGWPFTRTSSLRFLLSHFGSHVIAPCSSSELLTAQATDLLSVSLLMSIMETAIARCELHYARETNQLIDFEDDPTPVHDQPCFGQGPGDVARTEDALPEAEAYTENTWAEAPDTRKATPNGSASCDRLTPEESSEGADELGIIHEAIPVTLTRAKAQIISMDADQPEYTAGCASPGYHNPALPSVIFRLRSRGWLRSQRNMTPAYAQYNSVPASYTNWNRRGVEHAAQTHAFGRHIPHPIPQTSSNQLHMDVVESHPAAHEHTPFPRTLSLGPQPTAAISPARTFTFNKLWALQGFLNPHHPSPFTVSSVHYHHAAGFYHAAKFHFTHPSRAAALATVTQPLECAWLAGPSGPWRMSEAQKAEWRNRRRGVMYAAQYAKFAQNEELKRALLATGDAALVFGDAGEVWGCGRDGMGRNWLGEVLVGVRTVLRSERAEAQSPATVSETLTPESVGTVALFEDGVEQTPHTTPSRSLPAVTPRSWSSLLSKLRCVHDIRGKSAPGSDPASDTLIGLGIKLEDAGNSPGWDTPQSATAASRDHATPNVLAQEHLRTAANAIANYLANSLPGLRDSIHASYLTEIRRLSAQMSDQEKRIQLLQRQNRDLRQEVERDMAGYGNRLDTTVQVLSDENDRVWERLEMLEGKVDDARAGAARDVARDIDAETERQMDLMDME